VLDDLKLAGDAYNDLGSGSDLQLANVQLDDVGDPLVKVELDGGVPCGHGVVVLLFGLLLLHDRGVDELVADLDGERGDCEGRVGWELVNSFDGLVSSVSEALCQGQTGSRIDDGSLEFHASEQLGSRVVPDVKADYGRDVPDGRTNDPTSALGRLRN